MQIKEMISRYNGFTLVELIITVSIAGLLMSMAIPSFNEIISRSRLTTNINQLVASLNFSRSEAVKRNQSVTVRKVGNNWESGWTVFTDVNSNGVMNADDTLLKSYEAMPYGFTLRSTGVNRVTYRSSGIASNSSFVLCDNRDGNNLPEPYTSRLLIINSVGRVRMGVDNDNDGVPEKVNGTEIISCITSPFT